MDSFDESGYRDFFLRLTRHPPFDYQVAVARLLGEGNNIILRAPTGAGKTWSVLAPFLSSKWRKRPARLIYALPLRTLAQGIYREAREAAGKLGHPIESVEDHRGREVVPPFVTLQTGEQPDDRFFDRGRIIVTTYDQVLSGLLDGPYGLSNRLHNINAAAIAGALVVFDEFHLMEPSKAFLTATAGLFLFRELCQSVWMTATATSPLVDLIVDALKATCVPENEAQTQALVESLPSVTQVRRNLSVHTEPLSAESVLRRHSERSIVLLNTVGRAQAMYTELRRILVAEQRDNLMLLHSKFFKNDRRDKEEKLRSLFGRGTKGPAILVSTQVVEAGLDLSCEHLHTELCPMNSLVQRAGRCARFEGELGTVHVYPLPDEQRSWLPYGDLRSEDARLSATRALLESVGQVEMHPRRTAEWVQAVHKNADEEALRQGWRLRLNQCVGLIEQNAILRDPKRVADLIRGEDTDSIRVIVCEHGRLPERPGQREGLNLSRRSLYRVINKEGMDAGWYWDASDEQPWKSIGSPRDVATAYVVGLQPRIAAYDSEIGLRLGVAGTEQSPDRREPPRPGYAPLRAESWIDHAQAVAAEAQNRIEREHLVIGLLGKGFTQRYRLSAQAVRDAVVSCALLHDLGKLQKTWQHWAELAQRAQSATYEHVVPLAHTDFNPESERDRERERGLSVRRPNHAPASAFYAAPLFARLLANIPRGMRTQVASACAAAILAHHGGWLPAALDLDIATMCDGWQTAVTAALGWEPEPMPMRALEELGDKRRDMQRLLKLTAGSEVMAEWWPLVAYLTRTLRLSDQRATAERSCHE
jgi:CRISPR-associated endonuclease/helicase Cas3